MTDLDAFLADVGASQLGWPQSLRWTYDTTRDLLARGVPGDLVECGVGAGCHPAVMARACIDAGETRTVRLFDSFQGVPHGGEHDIEWNAAYGDGSGRLEATGMAACSSGDVMHNLRRWLIPDAPWAAHNFAAAYLLDDPEAWREAIYPSGGITVHEGWFQETLPQIVKHLGPIAFLRLDGDLYDSYRVCLEHLYPLVSSGGVVVVDDLNLDGCRAALRDFGLDPETFSPITESGDGWIRKS